MAQLGIECPHPSSFIDDELAARGWDRNMLIAAMEPHLLDANPGICRLMVDLYWEVGPTDCTCRMGADMAQALSGALGVSPDFFLNLESAWLAALARLEAE